MLLRKNIEEKKKHTCSTLFAKLGGNYFAKMDEKKNLILFTNQLTLTCSKSTIEIVEKGVKYVQS